MCFSTNHVVAETATCLDQRNRTQSHVELRRIYRVSVCKNAPRWIKCHSAAVVCVYFRSMDRRIYRSAPTQHPYQHQKASSARGLCFLRSNRLLRSCGRATGAWEQCSTCTKKKYQHSAAQCNTHSTSLLPFSPASHVFFFDKPMAPADVESSTAQSCSTWPHAPIQPNFLAYRKLCNASKLHASTFPY